MLVEFVHHADGAHLAGVVGVEPEAEVLGAPDVGAEGLLLRVLADLSVNLNGRHVVDQGEPIGLGYQRIERQRLILAFEPRRRLGRLGQGPGGGILI